MAAPRRVYRNFRLRVGRLSADKTYEVEASSDLTGPTGLDEKETGLYDETRFQVTDNGQTVDLLAQLQARKITPAQLVQLGVVLCDLLLIGSTRRQLLESLALARSYNPPRGLRLRLIFEAPELEALPWEYLYLYNEAAPAFAGSTPVAPSAGTLPSGPQNDVAAQYSEQNFLALQPDVSVVRHEYFKQSEPRIEMHGRYRLVAAAASPAGQPTLNVEADLKAIATMLEGRRQIGDVEAIWVRDATLKGLEDSLREPTEIFHFAGHGRQDTSTRKGQILLLDSAGQSSPMDSDRLASLLRQASVKLAILSACETAAASPANIWGAVAPALVQAGLAAVVASQLRLLDQSAGPLSEEIYRGVFAGQTLDEAVSNARLRIYRQSGLAKRDWGALALYMQVDDGVLFPRQEAGAITGVPIPRIAPAPLQTALIGRDSALAEQLTPGSKLFLYGLLGVGKTSLATDLFARALASNRFDGGYLWYRVPASAAALQDGGLAAALEWIASHFSDATVSQAPNSDAKVNALRDLLAARPAVLIGLDEVRHTRLAQGVLDAASGCALVLNGPNPPGVRAQLKSAEVAPLSVDQAMQLFLAPAGKTADDLTPEERTEARELCRSLRCLPLAVSLAAMKFAGGESLTTLRKRIAAGLLLPDQDEVAAVLETMAQDLQKEPAALRLILRLAGAPALEAPLEALRDGEEDFTFLRAKDSVVGLGIVSTAGVDRLALHPLLAHVPAAPEQIAAGREQMTQWLQNYVRTNRRNYNALSREHANLMALFDRHIKADDHQSILVLMDALFRYLRARGHWSEAYRLLDSAYLAARALHSAREQARVCTRQANLALLQSDEERAHACLDEADALYEQVNDMPGRGEVLYHRAARTMTRDMSAARSQFEQALVWMGDAAPADVRAAAHERLAALLDQQGDGDAARAHLTLALAISRADDDLETETQVCIMSGRIYRQAGLREAAVRDYARAEALAAQLGNLRETATLQSEQCGLRYEQGRYDDAEILAQQAIAICVTLGYLPGQAKAWQMLGNAQLVRDRDEDDLKAAETAFKTALDLNTRTKSALAALANRYGLGLVAQRRRQAETAAAIYTEVCKAADAQGDAALAAATRYQLGRLALDTNLTQAQRYAQQAFTRARKAQDRFTEIASLTLQGEILARRNEYKAAQKKLKAAHQGFAALDAPQAAIVKELLDTLETRLAQPPPTLQSGRNNTVPVEEDAFVEGIGTGSKIVVPVEGGTREFTERLRRLDVPVEGGQISAEVIENHDLRDDRIGGRLGFSERDGGPHGDNDRFGGGGGRI